jgi:hypothetical protein
MKPHFHALVDNAESLGACTYQYTGVRSVISW